MPSCHDTSPPPPQDFACDSCGACCRTWRVLVSDEDATREPRIRDEAPRLADHVATTHFAYQLFPLPFHDACCFLDAHQKCGIYSSRPSVCREFEPGGSCCQEARRRAGLKPLLPTAP